MSELVLSSEPLNRVLDGARPSAQAAYGIFAEALRRPGELLRAAGFLRERHRGGFVTFSKKAFFNLVNLCRDTCSYCTYKAEPGEAKLSMMSRRDVSGLAGLARRSRCVEALFVTGESPEQGYPEARRWLRRNGFSTTAEYVSHCCEVALLHGLFPHTNAGNLSKKEMSELKRTNVSMGLMLENASRRLSRGGGPHALAPSKSPGARTRVLADAGQLGIPMTTGLLLGIGETAREVVDSLFAIKKIHDEYGNIQEVIMQNFQPKPGTAMGGRPPAGHGYLMAAAALARVVMPDMNIQIPPNLSPGSYQDFMRAGINDWGGVSPLTPDFVNPEFPWPEIGSVEGRCREAGLALRCRFPVYPEFIHMVDGGLRLRMAEIADGEGYVREGYWR